MRAIFLDYATVSFNGDLDPAALQRAMPQLELRPHTSQADVAATIKGAEIVLVNKLRLSREVIERTPSLKLIALAATGTNNIDLDAARERGVAVRLVIPPLGLDLERYGTHPAGVGVHHPPEFLLHLAILAAEHRAFGDVGHRQWAQPPVEHLRACHQ